MCPCETVERARQRAESESVRASELASNSPRIRDFEFDSNYTGSGSVTWPIQFHFANSAEFAKSEFARNRITALLEM